MRRWGWTLAMVTCVSGCYIPGSGWTLRSGIDLRTYRKPAVFTEMVDTRWDEWNRVAQMNAMGGSCPVPGGGGLVVESSVYAATPQSSSPVTSTPTGAMAPVAGTLPAGSSASSGSDSPGSSFNEPVQVPPAAPSFPAVPGVEQLPPPPGLSPSPMNTAPPVTPNPSKDPVAQVAGQMSPRGPSLPDPVAMPAASQPAAQLGPGRLGGASGLSPSREILFDTPLDPERDRVLPADGIDESTGASERQGEVRSTRRDPRVELQSLVSDEPPEAAPGRDGRRKSLDLRDATVDNPGAKPEEAGAAPATTSAPVQPQRRWWSRLNPFAQ